MKTSKQLRIRLIAAFLALAVLANLGWRAWWVWEARQGDLWHLQSLIKGQGRTVAYLQIPWMTDLWKARQRAAAEGKPMLLWSMDGNPLCNT